MKSFNSYISEEEKVKKGKEVSVGKNTVKINPDSEELKEVAPPGAKYERMVKHIKKNYPKDKEGIAYATAWKQKNKDQKEGYAPGDVDQKVGAVTAIPQSERDAAKARLLAKTAAKRKEREMAKEEFEIEEGMTMKDFKANRQKNKRREASADAKKRGHVGKEWYNSGQTYSTDQAKRMRSKLDDAERRTRHRSAVDPDNEDDNNYSADRTKDSKKLRKQKAMGEETMLTFSQFMEARRMDREGADRGDAGRAARAEKAKASVAAAKAGKETRLKAGITHLQHKAEKEHAKNFPGSRQQPKVKGAKETPSETQNRRINRSNERKIKHGFTSKERKEAEAMAKHTSRFD